jgi:hypothetical protein
VKDLSFYDQMGILFPGAVLLIGLSVLFPELKAAVGAGGGVSLGDLGLFLVVAYVLGHLVAAAGEYLEKVVWARDGGMPSNWLNKPDFLWDGAVARIQAKLEKRLKIKRDIPKLDQEGVQKIFWPIYQDTLTQETGTNRITTFNGVYALSRGLAVALLALALMLPILTYFPARTVPDWPYWSVGLVAVAAIFIHRMRHFGRFFAKEVYRVFTQLPDDPAPRAAKKAEG